MQPWKEREPSEKGRPWEEREPSESEKGRPWEERELSESERGSDHGRRGSSVRVREGAAIVIKGVGFWVCVCVWEVG